MLRSLLIAAAAFGCSIPAAAVDFNQALLDIDNKPMLEQPGSPVVVTLGSACAVALLGNYQDEPNLTTEEKLRRFALAIKVRAAGEIDLTVEEAALIRKTIVKFPSILVVGRVISLIDPASMPK